jgi:hypothetical protein
MSKIAIFLLIDFVSAVAVLLAMAVSFRHRQTTSRSAGR